MYISPRDAESNVEAEPSVKVEIKTRRTGAALALYAIAGICLIALFVVATVIGTVRAGGALVVSWWCPDRAWPGRDR